MNNSVKQASARLGLELVRALREAEGSLPECDEILNQASREVVRAMHETHGEAWLGLINSPVNKPVLEKYTGEILNFQADFVIPKYDGVLVTLIQNRLSVARRAQAFSLAFLSGYTNSQDSIQVQAIQTHIRDLGGEILVWT